MQMGRGMMAFNLDNYMTAEQRIELFAKDNPDMRQESTWQVVDGMVFVTVKLWRTWADVNPWVVGLAGESIKTQFAIEKAETSAYARCITNTGLPQYSTTVDGNKAPRANREEMAKVVNYSPPGTRARAVENVLREAFAEDAKGEPTVWSVGDPIASLPVAPKVQECKHGTMILKEGTAKTGKPYLGYVCSAPKDEQCDPRWHKLTAAGSWYWDGGE
jgi:hypothetical protein